jgi:hypothetical protein
VPTTEDKYATNFNETWGHDDANSDGAGSIDKSVFHQ